MKNDARRGSDEYACMSEIARVEHEISVLRRHRDDLRVAIQQRLLTRVPGSGVIDAADTRGFELAAPQLERERTPWERDAMRHPDSQRAFAREHEQRGLRRDDWPDAQ